MAVGVVVWASIRSTVASVRTASTIQPGKLKGSTAAVIVSGIPHKRTRVLRNLIVYPIWLGGAPDHATCGRTHVMWPSPIGPRVKRPGVPPGLAALVHGLHDQRQVEVREARVRDALPVKRLLHHRHGGCLSVGSGWQADCRAHRVPPARHRIGPADATMHCNRSYSKPKLLVDFLGK